MSLCELCPISVVKYWFPLSCVIVWLNRAHTYLKYINGTNHLLMLAIGHSSYGSTIRIRCLWNLCWTRCAHATTTTALMKHSMESGHSFHVSLIYSKRNTLEALHIITNNTCNYRRDTEEISHLYTDILHIYRYIVIAAGLPHAHSHIIIIHYPNVIVISSIVFTSNNLNFCLVFRNFRINLAQNS